MVFNDAVMKEKLPKDTYQALKKTILSGTHLDLDVANVVATAMKEWATEKGATHFTHWFQPMTGITAEKHDAFISPDSEGRAILEFSGRSLVKGESDASSFPSGGLRATFEARGYTAWDPTSFAFIKDKVLCIPTAFCSYSGEALDKKTPLLRSMQALEREAMRILNLFGNHEVKRVVAQIGAEQEYFLIDKEAYSNRPDLICTGRTLIGARPAKGQELGDHYFGVIKKRVKDFMDELDSELWKLGILAKTEHNEVAPSQHELAPVYTSANTASDANQLTMELMKSVAARHNLVCLLHEKPFAGINGSGKHINWSISSETGVNFLEPGDTPRENAQFLLFLCAVVKAVDEYQELLRLSVASAGNDHRLGANEAPPGIVSVFLGDELTAILDSIENGTLYTDREKKMMEIGVTVLPHFPRDTTDRNRTSPFAFTGNKFEFRMPGSSISVAGPVIVLNTIVADALSQFSAVLEGSDDFNSDLSNLIKVTVKKHKRIVFNGNNYDHGWVAEAERRGISNLKTTPEALPSFASEKSIGLFTKHRVLSETEIRSRCDIMLENYCKILNIEALSMLDLVNKFVVPATLDYQRDLAETIQKKLAVNGSLACSLEKKLLEKLSALSDLLSERIDVLTAAIFRVRNNGMPLSEEASLYRSEVFPAMAELRECADELELIVGKKHWALPTYDEILTSVK